MESSKAAYESIYEYIARCPPEFQERLKDLRQVIRIAAPDAEEKISYQMPAFAQHGNLVYFAAQKRYIGLYPTASGITAFSDELAEYEHSKGSIHFPLDRPMPFDLIGRIVRFRVEENAKRAEGKPKKRK